MKLVRKVLFTLIVLFCAFYLISRPEDAAAAVKGAVGAVVSAINSIIEFFAELSK